MPKSDDVPGRVRQLASRLAEPKPMRRGSVSERSMKCGQPGCRCRDDPQARHGPYFTLTRAEEGKTRSRYLSPTQVAVARRQVQAGQHFRKDVDAYWRVCEQWADRQLDAAEAASEEAAKKGASKRRSTPKSSRRSKH